jgi:protein-tyrosine phosphatase
MATDDTAPVLGFHLFQVDDAGLLFISPAIHEWHLVAERGIDVVIDLEGGLDIGVPTVPNQVVYVYFPIFDEDLPDPHKLHGVVSLAAQVVAGGHRVLSHCGMGYNRSALIAGLVLVKLGMSGAEAVARLRQRRPGALFNPVFAEYLASLPAG